MSESRSMTTIDIDPILWARFNKIRSEKEYKALKEGLENTHKKIEVFDSLVTDYLNRKIKIQLKDEPTSENFIRKSVIISEENLVLLKKHREILRDMLPEDEYNKIKNRNIIIGLIKNYCSGQ